jgi:hypothetical protein
MAWRCCQLGDCIRAAGPHEHLVVFGGQIFRLWLCPICGPGVAQLERDLELALQAGAARLLGAPVYTERELELGGVPIPPAEHGEEGRGGSRRPPAWLAWLPVPFFHDAGGAEPPYLRRVK